MLYSSFIFKAKIVVLFKLIENYSSVYEKRFAKNCFFYRQLFIKFSNENKMPVKIKILIRNVLSDA